MFFMCRLMGNIIFFVLCVCVGVLIETKVKTETESMVRGTE